MPQGLQIFDASGTLVLDTSTKVLKRSTSISFTANNTTPATTPIPADSSFATISVMPISATAVPQRISAEISGSNIQYAARVADGLDYRLDVVFF